MALTRPTTRAQGGSERNRSVINFKGQRFARTDGGAPSRPPVRAARADARSIAVRGSPSTLWRKGNRHSVFLSRVAPVSSTVAAERVGLV